MQAFVINMDKDKSRLTTFMSDWNPIKSLSITRVPGIIGKDVRNTDQVTDFCKKFCTNGMIGCYASHLSIFKIIVDNNLPMAVILEDDAYPCIDFDTKFNLLVQKYVPINFDILLLGFTGNLKYNFESNVQTLLQGWKTRKYEKINDMVAIPYHALGAYGYMISLKFARKILEKYNKINYHIDSYLFTRDINLYATDPKIVLTHDSEESLGESYSFNLPVKYNSMRMDWLLHVAIFKNFLIWHFLMILFILILFSVFTYKKLKIYSLIPLITFLCFFNLMSRKAIQSDF